MNSQVKRYVGPQSMGASVSWSWKVPPSWHVDVFTNPEALHIP